jgi:D-alanyl-D-alanine carboxypeptidase
MRGARPVPDSVRSLAAVAVDGATGHTLAGRNADKRLAPASLTKMMTALVAVRRGNLTDPITATSRSLSEPSIIGLDPGDVLPLEDLLYGLLLPSGNDAALAIAEGVGVGSIETFVGWMNDEAAAMGLKNTRFTNPHGLDQAGHYSSARDMAAIARALMAEPPLATIVATPRHVVTGPPLYVFRSSNPILGIVPSVEGIKTGFTDDAGRCFAVSASRDGRRIIGIVLNSPNIGLDAQQLLESEFAASRPAALAVARPGFAEVRVDPSAGVGRTSAVLVGWEAPLLRAFQSGGATEIFLGRRLVGRW